MKDNSKKIINKTNKDEKIQDQAESMSIKIRPKEISPKEFGGPKGLEPTRYGDWEKKGRCIDF